MPSCEPEPPKAPSRTPALIHQPGPSEVNAGNHSDPPLPPDYTPSSRDNEGGPPATFISTGKLGLKGGERAAAAPNQNFGSLSGLC